MMDRRTALGGLAAAALGTLTARSVAQEDRSTINVLVGASSSMDFAARLIAEQLREALDRPAIVVSRLGAGQRIAIGEVRRAPPDGRTLLFVTDGPFSIYPNIYTNLDYHPDNDFTPVIGFSQFDVGIATGPATGAQNFKELIEWVRKQGQDGAVFASAPGNGSLSHFVGISTARATGVKLEHVPYKDSGVGGIDLMGGRIPILITGISSLVPLHKQGKLRLVAVSGEQRSPLLPDVPTLAESGVNVTYSTKTAVLGPAKLPAEIVQRLAQAIAPMRANPTIIDKIGQQAMTPWVASGADFAALIKQERRRFAELVKASGYVPQAA